MTRGHYMTPTQTMHWYKMVQVGRGPLPSNSGTLRFIGITKILMGQLLLVVKNKKTKLVQLVLVGSWVPPQRKPKFPTGWAY